MLLKNRILVDNIFPVLYYAYKAKKSWMLPDKPVVDNVASANFENIWEMFTKIFSDGLARLRRQGLYREYLERTEDLSTIRGKIDITGTIRNRVAQRRLVSCEYDELSENTLNNQILKTTAMLLLHERSVDSKFKKALMLEMRYFSRVDEIDPSTIQWSRLRYNRNNSSYRELIYYCWLILNNLMLMENGKRRLKRFFDEDEMASIYEKFILGYYQEEYQKKQRLEVRASQVSWAVTTIKEYQNEKEKHELLPKMQSDITLYYPNMKEPSKVLIIDAKWYKKILQPPKRVAGKKATEYVINNSEGPKEETNDSEGTGDEKNNEGMIRSAHLYQILSYVKNKEIEKKCEVSGMLLYARTNDVKAPELQIGEYTICNNKIQVRMLDLNRPFKDDNADGSVVDQLNKIADEFLSEATSSDSLNPQEKA